MPRVVQISGRPVGSGEPTFVIAEIGINHNGDLETAMKLIDAAVSAGCNAVKFQKRTPELCVPAGQRDVMRETPWGPMTYLQYRRRVEFDAGGYREIDRYCKGRGITWFASSWDEASVGFLEQFDPVCHKIPSACLTDEALLNRANRAGRPIIMSTGMSTMAQIRHAFSLLNPNRLLIAHSTSAYPCRVEELNLRMIETLRREFECPIGYSGHEVGLQTSLAAIVLGASFLERHITLDRALWGSDQAASVEPHGFARLVRDVRVVEKALGDGCKQVYASELAVRDRLRRV